MREALTFRVLYAEDEDGIRRLVTTVLKRLPRYLPQVDPRYAPLAATLTVEVVAANNGVQALTDWERSDRDFHLVITDQSMPVSTATGQGTSITSGLAGTDLLKRLIPEILARDGVAGQTVLMLYSSAAHAALHAAGLQESPVIAVDKPCDPTYLIQVIVEACRPVFDAMLATLPPPSQPEPPEAA